MKFKLQIYLEFFWREGSNIDDKKVYYELGKLGGEVYCEVF